MIDDFKLSLHFVFLIQKMNQLLPQPKILVTVDKIVRVVHDLESKRQYCPRVNDLDRYFPEIARRGAHGLLQIAR